MLVHVDEARAILTREAARHNAKPGRRGQGMNGRSYQQAFRRDFSRTDDGLAHL